MPWAIGPLVPLSFVVGYQADLAYGNKMERVIGQFYQIPLRERERRFVYSSRSFDIIIIIFKGSPN